MKAIVFDFDGVIHDTFETIYAIRQKLNPEVTKEMYRSYFEGNIFDKAPYHKNPVNKEEFHRLLSEAFLELKIREDIRTELEELRKKYDLYIISSNYLKNLQLYFQKNNCENMFKEIMSAETHKSKTEKFKMLFKKHHLDENSCIFVTDTSGDILEASIVGVKSIACTFGFHEEERLKKANPFKIASNFGEIRKILNSL
ncbi:MAG TPA: HAD-IA family hydrolase [Alphaproteobacteria bacterium]|nr:HAD-IA family hydrolase [Alphaproteobacteria bacterium]